MKTKKIVFLGVVLLVMISGGIFIEIEKAEACKCMVGGACLAGGGCEWTDVGVGTTCSDIKGFIDGVDRDSDHACYMGKSKFFNISVCMIDNLGTGRCCMEDKASCCTSTISTYKYCRQDKCGTYYEGDKIDDPSTNGKSCRVTTKGKDTCGHYPTIDGRWDYKENKCVLCGGDSMDNTEVGVYGDSGTTYVIGPAPYSMNADGLAAADNEFESACGADESCDEKSQGDACTGGHCDKNGKCCLSPKIVDANGDCVDVVGCGNGSIDQGEVCDKKGNVGCGAGEFCKADCSACITPCDPNDCSGTVTNAPCICGNKIASAGDYCCAGDSTNTYTYGGQAACQTNCGSTCTVAQQAVLKTSGSCNTADAPCALLKDLSPGASVRMKGVTAYDFHLIDPTGYSYYIPGSNSATVKKGRDEDSCVSSGTWTLKMDDTTCKVTINSTGNCPFCGNGVTEFGETCDISDGCSGATPVCKTDCSGCEAATSPSPSPSVPPCDSLDCGAAVTNANCMCGLQLVSVNGDYCCAADNYYGDNATCITKCGAAPPSPAPPPPAPPAPATPCGLGTGMFCNPVGWDSIPDIAEGMLNYLLGLVGSIALLFLIIAGVMYMTAGGSEEKITTAKRILTGAIIGLGIVLLAYSLLAEINKILSP